MARYQSDPGARPDIVAAFMSLVESVARRYHRGAEPLEDLVQVASVGLMKALRGFDPKRGGSFAAFAELAADLGVSVEAIVDARLASNAMRAASWTARPAATTTRP